MVFRYWTVPICVWFGHSYGFCASWMRVSFQVPNTRHTHQGHICTGSFIADRVLCDFGAIQPKPYRQNTSSKSRRKLSTEGAKLQSLRSIWPEEKRKKMWKDWDDEKAVIGWYEGATVDPAVDPARCQDANGGSFGGGNPSTPRNGMRAHDSFRSSRRKQYKMESDGLL